jgi:hypothetical protein
MTSVLGNFGDAIRQYIDNERRIYAHHSRPETKKIRRYKTASGAAFAHEYNLRTVQHLWVPATPTTLALRDEIPCEEYPASERNTRTGSNGIPTPGLHSNIYGTDELRSADLIRFTPENGRLDMVKRIIGALL